MPYSNLTSNYSGPTTTAKSEVEGRLKTDVGRKKRLLKAKLKNYA
jgi:hypothetical protein